MSVTNQNFLVSAETAYKGQKYLDKNFTIVSSLDQRGSAEELVGFLRNEGAILSKDSDQLKDLSKLFTYLGLLYKDSLKDMRICNWMRDSTQLIQDDREYAARLHEMTSIFYMVRQFHSRWSGRFSSVERGISLALEMRQHETITVNGPETFTDRFKWHLPNVNSRKGMAFLIAFASAHEKNTGTQSQSWVSFLKKYSSSANPEVKRLANYLLAHCEYHEKVYQRNVWSINPILKGKVNGEWADTTAKYFTCLEAATRSVLDFYEKHGKHDNFFQYNESALTGVVVVLEKMGELEREIADLTRLYGFFRHELNLTCRRLHKSRVAIQPYKKVYGEETFLPSMEDYSRMRPERLLAEPELPQKAPEKPSKKATKPKKPDHEQFVPIASSSSQSREERTVSSMPSTEVEVLEDEVEVITQKPGWREQIGMRHSNPVALSYPYHVTRWFVDAESALSEEPYCSQNPKQRDHSVFIHAFPLFVDQFVGTSYCHQSTFRNPRTNSTDTLYSIPVEVAKGDGSVIRGVCQYVIDSKTRVCYHRCIRSQHPDTFVQSFFNKKVWNEVDFPPLEKATQSSKKPRSKLKAEDVTFLYDREFGSVTFKENGNQVTLYRMS